MESKSIMLDVDDSPTVSQDELMFQDIPHSVGVPIDGVRGKPDGKNRSDKVQTHTFTNFPNPEESDDEDKSELLEGGKKSRPSFWTFEYYQAFFNVDTRQVVGRIIGSMYPNPNANYLQTRIRPNPDLYGPFWICTTLVFCIAIGGNVANYLLLHNAETHFVWKYDFHKVTLATSAIFAYWWLMPSMLYGLLWWRGNQAGYTFTELICIYGYSLAIYIPISILWVIPVTWLQWLLVMVGMALSGTVLILTLWPSVKNDKKQIALSTMVIVMALHGLLAVGFMLYFFHAPAIQDNIPTTTTALGGSNLTTAASSTFTTKLASSQSEQ